MTYDAIADEYYTPRRMTSRNFDAATQNAIAKLDWSGKDQTYIECGAGTGRTHEHLGISSLGFQLDSSLRMLSVSSREESSARVCVDCTCLPFFSCSTALVTAWLFDAFNDQRFYSEARRILASGGEFIGSLPSATWGHTLRRELNIPRAVTQFLRGDGTTVEVPSCLSTEEEIDLMLKHAGFDWWQIASGCIGGGRDEVISPHVQLVAELVDTLPTELQIVTIIRAVVE